MDTSPTTTTSQMDEHIKLATRIDCPILITGQTVHQREAVARLIHRGGQFVRVDCTTIDDFVFASALDHTSGGTLFVDEIGAMSPGMQTRLSHFLEQRALQRLESTSHSRPGEVRIITGSDGSLTNRIAANQFSADLFYRLNVIHIRLT